MATLGIVYGSETWPLRAKQLFRHPAREPAAPEEVADRSQRRGRDAPGMGCGWGGGVGGGEEELDLLIIVSSGARG